MTIVEEMRRVLDDQAAYHRILRRLELLTPGGSEFHNDADRCLDWVVDRYTMWKRNSIRAYKRVNGLRDLLTRALDALEYVEEATPELPGYAVRQELIEELRAEFNRRRADEVEA